MVLRKVKLRSHKDLGKGADVTLENGRYTVTPVDKRGLFGEPVEVKEEELVKTIQECMGLLPAKTE